MKTHGAAGLLLCAALLLPAIGAAAQDATVPDEDARQLFMRGLERLRADDYRGAAALFERSLQLDPTHSARFNLANAYMALDRCSEAQRHFEALLRSLEADPHPALQERVRAQLDAALPGCFAQLQVAVSPATAQLQVDGAPRRPAALRLDPGSHVLDLRAPGFQAEQRTLTLARGERMRIEWTLPRAQVAGAARRGAATAARSAASSSDVSPRLAAWVTAGLGVVGAATSGVLWVVTDERHREYEARARAFNQDTLRALDADSSARRELATRAREITQMGEDVGRLKTALVATAAVTVVAGALSTWLWTTSEPASPRVGSGPSMMVGSLRF